MIYYAYDSNGWLVGQHEDAAHPSSTPLDFRPIAPRRARFVAGAWTDDPGQEQADAAAVVASDAERTDRQLARAYFRDLNWQTIADPVTRTTLRHLWRLLRRLDTDGT